MSLLPVVDASVVLSFASLIFLIGLVGVVIRRNLLVILMCVELMLNAVNLTFITFSGQWVALDGQMASFFVMTVAAAESAVGLGLIIALFRTLRSVDTDQIQLLKQ